MIFRPLSILALAVTATTVSAGPDAMPLIYEQFEAAVPHTDLESCPGDLAQDGTFCRATLNHEEVHVFVFSEEGDSPLVGFASYPADGIGALLK